MKSYTDIEQSRDLEKILPLESADLYYYKYGLPHFIEGQGDYESIKTDKYHDYIPCWSLAALLGILPKHIGDSVLRMDMSENDFNLWFDDLSGIVDILLPDITKDNPIDACVEMIIRLNEQKLL